MLNVRFDCKLTLLVWDSKYIMGHPAASADQLKDDHAAQTHRLKFVLLNLLQTAVEMAEKRCLLFLLAAGAICMIMAHNGTVTDIYMLI